MKNPFKNAEDKLLFAKVLDKLVQAQKNFTQTHTEFLDPVRCETFMRTLPQNPGVTVTSCGGHDSAERKIIVFRVEEGEGDDGEQNPITPIAVTYNSQFSKSPTHRDYLGSVLGLGLDRSMIGDILLGEDGAVLYVLESIADYIAENLNQVGRATVKAEARKLLPGLASLATTRRINVPSMRLDAVLGAALNFSRGKAAMFIDSDRVFVNWKPTKKTHTVAPGDNITVRGVGRVKVETVEGTTKKDRIILTVTVSK